MFTEKYSIWLVIKVLTVSNLQIDDTGDDVITITQRIRGEEC